MGKVTLSDTGEFYNSLDDKVVHTAENKGGGTVVVGISEPKVLSINHMSDRQREEISRLILENTVSY